MKHKSFARNAAAMIYMVAVIIMAATAVSAFAQGSKSTATDKEEKKTYPPGSAWTLSWPLGSHMESTMDTVLYNYQREFVTALGSDAWASTGQYTGPAINMIYFQRPEAMPFYFDNSLSYWIPTFAEQKFYNVFIPYTQLSYGMGYGTENRTDHLQARFAGNVNRKVGIGAWVEYPYTKGSYADQATKGLGWGLSVYYTGTHYDLQMFFNHYNHLNKENGGITDDLYIENPAKLQGGVNDIEAKSIPVNLTAAHSRLRGSEVYMSHAYKLGFWRDITQEEDTVPREEFVPVTKFVYSFNYEDNYHMFKNTNVNQDATFWKERYFSATGTNDDAYRWSVSNTLGVEMIEGFHKWAKFGLSAYATYEIDQNRYEVEGMQDFIDAQPEDTETESEEGSGLTELPEGWQNALKKTRHRLWVGARIAKTKGSILRYEADAKFGLVGESAGDIDVGGKIETRFRLWKDTVRIQADGFFRNLEPNYFLKHYVSNHFIWNNDFGKIRSFRVGGLLDIPWTKTELRVGFENVQNQVYFNDLSRPQQYSGHVQVFSAAIEQRLQFGIWNWNNTVTYQTSSNTDIIPLPALSVYSNMFLYFHAFKALTVQIGIDCNWYSKYRGLAYQPATMTFCQQGENAVDVGNFIFSDVYLTAKLYKVRFFLMCSHLNQRWFSRNYFALPHYPVDPRQFRLGLSIDFAN